MVNTRKSASGFVPTFFHGSIIRLLGKTARLNRYLEQMRQRFLVRPVLLLGQLRRALCQLRRHRLGFVRRAAQPRQNAGDLLLAHGHFTESAGTILTLCTSTRLVGRLFSPPLPWVVGTSPILPSASSPLINWPNPVYFPSRKCASARQMKNCDPAESGSFDRAIEMTPRTCDFLLNSALSR